VSFDASLLLIFSMTVGKYWYAALDEEF